jgi:hypothetical protein
MDGAGVREVDQIANGRFCLIGDRSTSRSSSSPVLVGRRRWGVSVWMSLEASWELIRRAAEGRAPSPGGDCDRRGSPGSDPSNPGGPLLLQIMGAFAGC